MRLRAGDVRDGKWIIFVELANEWEKVSGVWYPRHHARTAFYGNDLKPVHEIDLTVRNLKANGAVNLPDSAFTLSAMNIPDGTAGLDRRQKPGGASFAPGAW